MRIFTDGDSAYKNLQPHTITQKKPQKDDSLLIILVLILFLFELKDNDEKKTSKEK